MFCKQYFDPCFIWAIIAGFIICFCPALAYSKPEQSTLAFQRHSVDPQSRSGIPLGGFLLTPLVSYDFVYQDNVFLKKADPKEDLISVYRPAISLQSNWARHEVYAGLQANKTDYRRYSQKDSLDYGAIVSGVYDITYGTYLDGYLRHDRQSLTRGSEDDINGEVPIQYDVWASRIGLTRALSYIQAKGFVFHDYMERHGRRSTSVNGDILTRERKGAEVTFAYEYLPQNNVFLTLSRIHAEDSVIGADNRTIYKNEFKYGVNFNHSNIYQAMVYFGNTQTDYSHISAQLKDPFAGLNLKWSPTEQTYMTLSTGRYYREGSISGNERVETDSTKIDIFHQLTDSIMGNLTGFMADYTYKTLSGSFLRQNRIYGTGLHFDYRLSDHFGFKFGYDYKRRNSDDITDEYINNLWLFSVNYMH